MVIKSRYTTYTLLTIALLLWGLIVKKIFFSSPPDSPYNAVKSERDSVRSETGDTLFLNYRDPFLDSRESQYDQEDQAEISGPSVVEPVEKIAIQYTGKIRVEGTTHYIVELAGEQYTLLPGERFKEYRLYKAYEDSIVFIRDGLFYTVPLTQ